MSQLKSPSKQDNIFMTPKRHISQSNRKILSQSVNNAKHVPQAMMRKYERSQDKKYSLSDKFKNMEDPLRFNHSQKIQRMMRDTQQASQCFRQHLNQVMELSKVAYKQIIARQTSEFNAQRFKDNFFDFNPTKKQQNLTPKAKSKTQKQSNQNTENQKYSSVHPKLKEMHEKYMRTPVKMKRRQSAYSGQVRQLRQKRDSEVQLKSLTWAQIKLIDTPSFDTLCSDFQFYNLLRSDRKQRPINTNRDYNICQSKPVQKIMKHILPCLIEDNSYQYSQKSTTALRFNFEENLRFHKHEKSGYQGLYGHKRAKQQQIMSMFDQIDPRKPPTKSLYDLAMKKITPIMIQDYMKIKNQHREEMKYFDRAHENLQLMYHQLLQEFEMAKIVYKNSKQNASKKYVHTWANTIGELKDKDLDTYFKQDVHLILQKIIKLDDLRQKVLKSRKQKPQLTLIKNICLDIKWVLFQLLMTMLKGEKFYDKTQKQVPFFTYADLINVQGRQQLQRRVLQVVYHKMEEFTVQEVDGVPKSEIISIYTEEREKNNRILGILERE